MKTADIAYIIQTESYLEKERENMPSTVYEFIKQVCFDERRYIELVESVGKEKKVFKV